MSQSRQVKRKLSDTLNSDPPKYSEIESPLSDSGQRDKSGDHDLVSAAEALTRLTTSATPPPSFSDENSETPQMGSPLSSTSMQDMGQQIHPIVQSVNTISRLPLVTNAVKYYEDSKRNYATFNYAAGIVEKAAMPVFNKLEVNLNTMHQTRLEERARLKKKRRVQGQREDKNEIKKRLMFCLHILKLANENISAKVNDLQEKIKEADASPEVAVKAESPPGEDISGNTSHTEHFSRESTADIPENALQTNSEIVATVKKIVHVISNFRPSSLQISEGENDDSSDLGEEVKLKKTIREIILGLPKQVSSSVPSAQKAPNQAISFARESLEMIGRLTTVFNEQLEKAEDWVDGPTEERVVAMHEDQGSAMSVSTRVEDPGTHKLNTEASHRSV